MWFTSDNAAAAAPEILAAVATANAGKARAYGGDPSMDRVDALVREVFEAPQARVHLVATGTAANALALACLCPPWGAILAHADSHVERDECGAPAFYSGGAMRLLPGQDAKIPADALRAELAARPGGDVHHSRPAVLSLTQATERGAVYSAAEVADLCAVAKDAGLRVHMDGARFANALARTGASPAEMTWRAGVDALCLGATKNGALAAEAVILFDPAPSWEFELRRKRGGHLFSKMRFVAAQMEAYLTGGLWLRLAARANAMADRLAAGLAGGAVAVTNRVEANILFVEMDAATHARLTAAGAVYYTMGEADGRVTARLVTAFDTTEAEVDRFAELARESRLRPDGDGAAPGGKV